jgi:hypothetical protein
LAFSVTSRLGLCEGGALIDEVRRILSTFAVG